ncbi:tRNA (adenosine(37)-N6)-threonylcarbamoyltransferase complex dimerization subunit type 1 TsaB [Candidatus Saccharibacteria bacterium]|nr:tRNA (adenosine(37)-N6)-threonylcarbamoyltransferase complex dimerization subunit type 1 TsaB [Candidatus Saccharibacteria bacterium]MBP5656452.1 tRNA (adenosine(37)-N6)-threonylcarbamoyltransferase complex dimerization subunit type 1 TsaB [Candidatus Saccharibacteria bacterium]
MKLYLDTSTSKTIMKLDENTYEWESGRDLAKHLLKFIHEKLQENGKDWQDIEEITFMSGPGSFTGLRIGATVVNTLAEQLKVPLFNHRGEKVGLIMPEYGRPANITPPKK